MLRVFIAALLLAASCARASSVEERDPWFASNLGDWVIMEQTTIREGQPPEVRLMKKVRTDRLDLGVAISVYVAEQGDFPAEETELIMHDPGKLPEIAFKQSDPKPTQINVGGTKVDCDYIEYTYEQPGLDKEISIKVWSSPQVAIPYRELSVLGPDMALMPDVLRMDYEVINRGSSQNATLRVESLNTPMTVAGREISCIFEKGKAQVTQGEALMSSEFQRWLSPKVPGGVVLFESNLLIQGSPVKLTEKVIDFGYGEAPQAAQPAPKPAPVAPAPKRDVTAAPTTTPAPKPTTTPAPSSTPASSAPVDAPVVVPTLARESAELKLTASGETYLLIKDAVTNTALPGIPKSLGDGETITLTIEGPIVIAASKVENLSVQIGDQTYQAEGMNGVAKWYFNASGPYTP